MKLRDLILRKTNEVREGLLAAGINGIVANVELRFREGKDGVGLTLQYPMPITQSQKGELEKPYQCSPNTDLRARNRALKERELDEGAVHLESFPSELIFSSEHRCNLRCVMCAATVQRNQGLVPLMDRKLPDDSLERFHKLDGVAPYFETASLTGSGEPLINPHLPEMLEVLKRHEIPVTFNTHGNLLDRGKAEMLVERGLHNLTISVDASTQQTYERVRAKGKWDKLIAGVRTLVEVKHERGATRPRIVLAGNFMRQNVEELPGLVDLAADLGAQAVLATNTVIYDVAMKDEALSLHPDLTRRMVLEASARASRRGVEFENRLLDLPPDSSAQEKAPPNPPAPRRSPILRACQAPSKGLKVESEGSVKVLLLAPRRRVENRLLDLPPDSSAQEKAPPNPPAPRRSSILRACQAPWKGLMVESEGSVKVCCFNSPYVGNLNKQSFEDIWNGEPLKDLRASFVEDRPPEGCRTCFIFMQSRQEQNAEQHEFAQESIRRMKAQDGL